MQTDPTIMGVIKSYYKIEEIDYWLLSGINDPNLIYIFIYLSIVFNMMVTVSDIL